jgi:hypothetical protein
VNLDLVALLESTRDVADAYGLPPGTVKPCIAPLLDGNLGGAGRHDAAFVIAIDLRGAGFARTEVERVINSWAAQIGYRLRDAQRAVTSAFAKRPDGAYRYHPPGLRKHAGTKYHALLNPVCEEIGCPANCPPLRQLHAGIRAEDSERFQELSWACWLRRRRWRAACDVYLGICRLEQLRKLPCGAPIRTSYRQLASIVEANARTVGRELYRLDALGLIAFTPGSGSGPHAHDRVGSLICRVIPIPSPPSSTPSHSRNNNRRHATTSNRWSARNQEELV